MAEIPVTVREFLSTNDSLVRAQLAQRSPELKEQLADPATRAGLLDWLSGEQAWAEEMTIFTLNTLKHLRPQASPEEAGIVRSFLLHPNSQVRLAAYEFLLTLYFPDKNREALLQLLQNMLSDDDEMLRAEGARYIDQSGAVQELRGFLERWQQTATRRDWQSTESFELVSRVLKR